VPTNLSDFCSKIAAQVTPSGAIFRTTVNPDGSIQILRSASGVSGVSGGPTSPWTVYMARVIYNVVSDTVLIGDGSIMSASTASALIAGLN
jgi:hypothetical protein